MFWSEIENTPLWIVRCHHVNAKKNKPEYIIVRVMDKKEDRIFAVTPELREMMNGETVKYFQAALFSDNVDLVREIADPEWQKSLVEKAD